MTEGRMTTIYLPRKNTGWLHATGIALLLAGIVASVLPLLSSLKAETVLGFDLFGVGVTYLIIAFHVYEWRDITWESAKTILFLFTGMILLSDPYNGVFTLTVILGSFFIIHGIIRLFLAVSWRHWAAWRWMFLGSIISISLGLMVIISLPRPALWFLGLLLGIDLIFSGMKLLSEKAPL